MLSFLIHAFPKACVSLYPVWEGAQHCRGWAGVGELFLYRNRVGKKSQGSTSSVINFFH